MLSKQAGNSLVIFLILLGLISGGVLLETSLGKNIHPSPAPSASVPQIDDKPTLALSLDQSSDAGQFKKDQQFKVLVSVSTKEAVNLIAAKVHYPKELVKVIAVDNAAEPNPIPMWVSKNDVTDENFVELVGGIPSPGLKTDGERVTFAAITLQMLQNLDDKSLTLTPSDIELYSDKDNKPLENVDAIVLTAKNQPITASSAPNSSSPSPSAVLTKNGSLFLSPSIIQTSPSCNFDLTLNYDSANAAFLGIDALLTIDTKVLKPIRIATTDNMADGHFAPQLSLTGDTITIAYLSPQKGEYRKNGSLGKITFKVTDQKVEGMTAIKIKYNPNQKNDLTDSNILSSLTGDSLATVKNSFVLVKKGTCNNTEPKTYQILK